MKFIALLRGVNVSGHHKVPMAELKSQMIEWGYTDVITLLNSGNIIFRSPEEDPAKNETRLAHLLEEHFGFSIPVRIRTKQEIEDLIINNPFKNSPVTENTRLYFSFLSKEPILPVQCPWVSTDGSFRIIEIRETAVCSILDLNITKTTQGMEKLEKLFGKNITTRNLNTIMKIYDKL